MKKKLLISLSSVGLAAGFWACGSGTIEPLNEETDGYVQAMLETGSIDFSTQVADAKKSCAENDICANEMAKAEGAAIQIESSETINPNTSSDGTVPVASSSSGVIFKFSSGGDIGVKSSSSVDPNPASSADTTTQVPQMTGMGRCFPNSKTVDLGGSVTWSIEWNNDVVSQTDLFGSPTYSWNFGEGAATTTGNTKSPTVTYSVSGPQTASVDVTVAKGSKKGTIVCDGLNVNGAKITGCKCSPVNTQPDVAAGEVAQWKAVGCTSTANIISYTWTGATADPADATGLSAMAAVTVKDEEVKGVSFTVANDDNSQETIACENAKAIDSRIPDYEITTSQGKVTLPAAGDYTVVVSSGGNITQCRMSAQSEQQASITINSVTVQGQYYIPMGSNGVVDNSWCNSSLKVTVTAPVTIEASWN